MSLVQVRSNRWYRDSRLEVSAADIVALRAIANGLRYYTDESRMDAKSGCWPEDSPSNS